MPWSNALWKRIIHDVRTRWERKYSEGQDDAAELLGDILYDCEPRHVSVHDSICLRACGCDHQWVTTTDYMMLVLQFPAQVSADDFHEAVYTISSLLEHYTVEYMIEDIECGVCGIRQAFGFGSRTVHSSSETMIVRINRYDDIRNVQVKRDCRLGRE